MEDDQVIGENHSPKERINYKTLKRNVRKPTVFVLGGMSGSIKPEENGGTSRLKAHSSHKSLFSETHYLQKCFKLY